MNFDFTDDQQQIKRTARELLSARLRPDRLRELAEGRRYDDGVWAELVRLGWPGIAVAEEYAGQGLGLIELAILQEELGYALAPVPMLSTAAAALFVQSAGSPEQRERWLPGLVDGGERGTVGVARDGAARLVPDADGATALVLLQDGGARLLQADDVEVDAVEALDTTRRYASVAASGAGEPLPGDVEAASAQVAIALAAESVGVAQRTMEMAVEYAKDRKQFGQPIGTNQAVSHRCAQMLLETESARSATYYAAWAADHEPASLPLAAAAAKAYASDAAWRVAASSLQGHGGIGFTWEHDLHFFLKRATVNARLYGSANEHRERVAELITAPVA
jgi:alkylation response protein AidB-like acyl-CoA dehydrogenase